MNKWKHVERLELPNVAYDGPALVMEMAEARPQKLFVGNLLAVIPLLNYDGSQFKHDEYLPFVYGLNAGGNHNTFSADRFYELPGAKREALLRLRAQCGVY